jgi:predicted RNase H-like HicB family nuclease
VESVDVDRDEVPEQSEDLIHGYRVLYERLPSNWSAYTPGLPVIVVTGPTYEHCRQAMAEEIPAHLESLREDRAERPWLYSPDSLSPELRAVFARIDASRPGAEP